MTAWTSDAWRGKRVTVAGLGTFGGQIAAAKFFAGLGAKVTVTDKKKREAFEGSLAELEALGVRAALGGHDERDFTAADLIVASPAIPETSPYLVAAARAGVPMTHEMNVFFDICRAPIIAVTGSNGKSTTTALLAHIMTKAVAEGLCARPYRKVWLGGNIGRSLILDVGDISRDDLVVLELSSFQLEDLGPLGRSPWGAVVTNLTPNHLDRHVTFENYANAKRQVTLHQRPGDFLVLNADDPNLAGWDDTRARVRWFGAAKPAGTSRDGVYFERKALVEESLGATKKLDVPRGWQLIGLHNVANLSAACAAAGEAGVALADALAAAEDFHALPHRCEFVGEVRGVSFYNDSIATTPESVEVALESFEAPIILIAGGYDKGVDLAPFAAKAARSAKALLLIGATGDGLEKAARAARPDAPIMRPASFHDAIVAAFEAAEAGDVVLMSPACASYDMFNNFQERGDIFRREVEDIRKGAK